MPFQPMPPHPALPAVRRTPPPPPPLPSPMMNAQDLPTFKRGPRKWPWLIVLAFLFFLAPPIGWPIAFFWLLAIGVMPHVAAFKVLTGNNR